MTDRENSFLVKIGITPGPWEYIDNHVRGIFNPGGDSPGSACDKRHGDFIAQSPAMFLALWNSIMQGMCILQFCEDELISEDRRVKTVEFASGKTWQQLCEIWEATA